MRGSSRNKTFSGLALYLELCSVKDSSLWLVLLSRTRLRQSEAALAQQSGSWASCVQVRTSDAGGWGGFLNSETAWLMRTSLAVLGKLVWLSSSLLLSLSWSSDPLDRRLGQLCLQPEDIEEATSDMGSPPLRSPSFRGWAAHINFPSGSRQWLPIN